MHPVSRTAVIVFIEWLRRKEVTLPLNPDSQADYNRYVDEFVDAVGANSFVKSDLQNQFDVFRGDAGSAPIQTLGSRSGQSFITRYLSIPNHGVVIAAADAEADRKVRSYIANHTRDFSALLGDTIDLYVSDADRESGYEALSIVKTLPGAGALDAEHMPVLFVWSDAATAIVSLKDADEPALAFRRIVTELGKEKGPITQAIAAKVVMLAAAPAAADAGARSGKNRFAPAWLLSALGTILVGVVIAWLGDLVGLRQVVCDLQVAESTCQALFGADEP